MRLTDVNFSFNSVHVDMKMAINKLQNESGKKKECFQI